MPRHFDDDLSYPADERAADLTAQFWGGSPSWGTTGGGRRPRSVGHSGPVARTRRHGDRTGQIPATPVVATGTAHRTIPDAAHRSERNEFAELVDFVDERPPDPTAQLAARLGLGAVDPLLLRLGVIVLLGVLLVPLALALRPGPGGRAVGAELASTAAGAELAIALVAPDPGATVLVAAPDAPFETSAMPDAAATPAQSPSPVVTSVAAVEPAETGSTGAALTPAAGDTQADVAESIAAPAPSQVGSGAADVDQPAERVAPACSVTYTVVAGDYWIRLADASGTTLADLLQANLASDRTPLFPGDSVCIPAGGIMPSPPVTTTTTTTTAAPAATPPPPAPSAPATTAPPPTAAPTTVPVTVPPSASAVEAIIREVWPDDLEDKALAIAWRESGYRPAAQSWCCYGLFQLYWEVHKSWMASLGITGPGQLLDARTNAIAAYGLYQRSGWGPWGG